MTTYKIKCRSCGKITKMAFGVYENSEYKMLQKWASEHCTFPVQHHCECDPGSTVFHDLISYANAESKTE